MLNSRFLGLAAALAVFSACADGPLESDPLDTRLFAVTDRTVKMVPFKASHRNTPADVGQFVCPAGELAGVVTVNGKGTHLGNYTGGNTSCVHLVTGTFSSIDATFIAANGDELRAEMDPLNPGQIIVFDLTTLELVIVGGLNVTGGTGRFDGATGKIAFRSDALIGVPGSAVLTLDGMISSPGSIKWSTP